MSYPLPKDPLMAAFLQKMRDNNRKIASQCHICKKQSTEINSYGYRIKFVCDDHFEAGVETIIPNDIPGVHHQIYPNGLYIGDKLNPNEGGWFGKKKENQLEQTDPICPKTTRPK